MATRIRRTAALEFPAQTWDDFGNAARLVDRYADRLRWVADGGHWAVYDDSVALWRLVGQDHAARGLMRKVVERMAEEEAPAYTGDDAPKWRAWVKRQGSAKAISGALSVAQTKRALVSTMKDFDQDDGILHCANGVLDLKTLELRPHSPTDMLTVGSGIDYRRGARAKAWEDFLQTFFPDQGVRSFTQLLFGISLLTGNPEKLMVMVKGPGNSGKSSLNSLVGASLGRYSQDVELSMFKSNNQRGKPDPALVKALPARYIAATEAGSAWTLHADQIKRLTGNDVMQARNLQSNGFIERRPGFTPWIFTNEMPQINGRDEALMNRLVVLPMTTVPPRVQRGATAEMLRSPRVLRAVLAWMVQGLERYNDSGLPARSAWPRAVGKAVTESVSDMSLTDAWMAQCCRVGEGEEQMNHLYASYESWCAGNNVRDADKLNNVWLGRHLSGLGIHSVKTGRIRVRSGIALR